jgi:hypothetical protein
MPGTQVPGLGKALPRRGTTLEAIPRVLRTTTAFFLALL